MAWIKRVPYEKPHYCNKPSSVRWFKQQFAPGSEWECDVCGERWYFLERRSDFDDSWDVWKKSKEAHVQGPTYRD